MNCKQATELIFAIDASCDEPALQSHLQGCASCRELSEKHTLISAALRSEQQQQHSPRRTDPDEADLRVLDRAMHQIRSSQAADDRSTSRWHFGLGAGLGFALAASLFIALFGNVLITGTDDSLQSPLAAINMTANLQHSVSIEFDSPQAVAEATITITLPDHINIAGYDTQRLSWKTSLKSGKNTLKLPLIANRSGKGIILSELMIGDDSRSFELAVDVRPQNDSNRTSSLLNS